MTSPEHYKTQTIQPIDYMRSCLTSDEFRGFLKGNILKYISRADKKNGREDYEKALVYLEWLIEVS